VLTCRVISSAIVVSGDPDVAPLIDSDAFFEFEDTSFFRDQTLAVLSASSIGVDAPGTLLSLGIGLLALALVSRKHLRLVRSVS
jgi:hypothetical protein